MQSVVKLLLVMKRPATPIFKSVFIILAIGARFTLSQQVPDLEYRPPIPNPAYSSGKGPQVSIDEAHHNFHTANGRFEPFAQLLRRDGYVVGRLREPLSSTSLKQIDVVVIANPIHARNQGNWTLPTPSAYSKKEIGALRDWVEIGGALLLIADHMPFPGGAGELAESFGFRFSNGFARFGNKQPGKPGTFDLANGLKANVVIRGRNEAEAVDEIVTFTGSAFQAPAAAIPLMVFGPGSVSLEPQRAWQFKDDTPQRPIEGWCQGAILEVGEGRVAVFGEAAMFTAQLAGPDKRRIGMSSPQAKQNHQFLLNVLHWLSGAL